MLSELMNNSESLPADARETASLVCCHFYKCAYSTSAHRNIATRSQLLTEQQVDAIVDDTKPEDLNDNCSIAYDTAHYLLYVRGSLPQEIWAKAVAAFGTRGTVELIHSVALYSWTSLGLNATDVQPAS